MTTSADLESALVRARAIGFLEIALSKDGCQLPLGDSDGVQFVGAQWESERAAAGHHAVTLGQVADDEYFVAVSFRPDHLELGYILEEMRHAYLNVGVEPVTDAEVGNGLFGGPMARVDAVRVARTLLAIDDGGRDADFDIAFVVMTS